MEHLDIYSARSDEERPVRKHPKRARMLQLERAFLDHGYSELSMGGLAEACDLTTRALYYYFSSKEDAFRAVVRFSNELLLLTSFAAARGCFENGGDILDIVSALMNARYADTRRLANVLPDVADINTESLKRCYDVLMQAALRFESDLTKFLGELRDAGLLRLRVGVSLEHLAQALNNGARGVDHRLPRVTPQVAQEAYREMCWFVLFGTAEKPTIRKLQRRRASADQAASAHH